MRYDLYIQIYQYSKFHQFIFDFFSGNLKIWWSKFRRGVLRDEFLVIFWTEHGHNSSNLWFESLTQHISLYILKFPKIAQNPKTTVLCLDTRSSSGWVLTDLKVLPSFFHHLRNFFHIYLMAISQLVFNISTLLAKNVQYLPPLFNDITLETCMWKSQCVAYICVLSQSYMIQSIWKLKAEIAYFSQIIEI